MFPIRKLVPGESKKTKHPTGFVKRNGREIVERRLNFTHRHELWIGDNLSIKYPLIHTCRSPSSNHFSTYVTDTTAIQGFNGGAHQGLASILVDLFGMVFLHDSADPVRVCWENSPFHTIFLFTPSFLSNVFKMILS
jgi:hypothetical protein